MMDETQPKTEYATANGTEVNGSKQQHYTRTNLQPHTTELEAVWRAVMPPSAVMWDVFCVLSGMLCDMPVTTPGL
jgi:hypothetical protein